MVSHPAPGLDGVWERAKERWHQCTRARGPGSSQEAARHAHSLAAKVQGAVATAICTPGPATVNQRHLQTFSSPQFSPWALWPPANGRQCSRCPWQALPGPRVLSCTLNLCSKQHSADEGPVPKLGPLPRPAHPWGARWGRGAWGADTCAGQTPGRWKLVSRQSPTPQAKFPGECPFSPGHPVCAWVLQGKDPEWPLTSSA